eukprot:scaffold261_cov336-Pavlova_lutheri.AAC.14
MQKIAEEVRKATGTCSRKYGMRSDQSEEPVRSRKSDTVMERQANQKRESLLCRSCCRPTKNPTLFFQDLALAAKNARKTKAPEKLWMCLKKRMQLVEVCWKSSRGKDLTRTVSLNVARPWLQHIDPRVSQSLQRTRLCWPRCSVHSVLYSSILAAVREGDGAWQATFLASFLLRNREMNVN